uniref:Uncharacterized protein n=1 Tax=Lepeophtheirus salmonis TaxID=72036 RepID=A0A0K2VIN7_LEPSM
MKLVSVLLYFQSFDGIIIKVGNFGKNIKACEEKGKNTYGID